MATITLTITDDARGGVTAVCESDPDIALDARGDPRLDELTPAQGLLLMVLMEIGEHLEGFEWRTLIK